jgi:hypothetical protein
MAKLHFVCLMVLLALSAPALAQTAQISGAIMDSSGGVIPGAEIAAVNTRTGVKRLTSSNETGNYALPLLQPGEYQVTVRKDGFRHISRSGVSLEVDQVARIDFILEVGAVSERIDVVAPAPLVSVDSGTLKQVIDQKRIVELPLNGRNAGELVFLTAGAINDTGQSGRGYVNSSTVIPGTTVPSINGARSNSVNFRLDGANNNSNYSSVSNPFPNPDALQEFSIQTSNYSAEYGNATGGVVNVQTKSGTNEFHGSVFEFVRNGRLNARSFFATARDGLKRNQFGGSFGGPIVRNNMFFFTSYQSTRLRATRGGLSQFVFTDPMRSGDFSGVSGNLRDPATAQPFPGGRLPASRIDPVSTKLLDYMPRSPDPTGRLLYSLPDQTDYDEFLGKGDQTRGRHTMSQRYFLSQRNTPGILPDPKVLTQAVSGRTTRIQTLGINDVYAVSPTLLNSFTFTYSHTRGSSDPIAPFGPADLGINIAQSKIPALSISMSGWAGYSLTWNFDFTADNLEFADSITWMRGKHQMIFGGAITQLKQGIANDYQRNGVFTFSNDITGNSAANFLLGELTRFEQGGGEFKALRAWRPGLFFQDNYRVKPSLTLNLGLRLDPWLPYSDELGRVTCFQPGRQSQRFRNAPAGLLYAGDAGCPDGGHRRSFGKFSPRFGFAWSPGANSRWSLRGGYGIFFEQPETQLYNGFVNIAPFSPQVLISGVKFSDPYRGAVNPFPQKFGPRDPPADEQFELPVQGRSFDADYTPSYVQNWNLTFERQLGGSVVTRAAYVGAKGTHLRLNSETNPAVFGPAATVANTQQRRLNPIFSAIEQAFAAGDSSYHSLQVGVEKRMSRVLSLFSNYTFSKSIDHSSNNATLFNPYDFGSNRALSDFDVPHRFVLATIYALPELAGSAGLTKQVLGGWQVSGIWNWQSGFPFSINSGVDNSRSGVGLDRADYIGPTSPALTDDRPKQEVLGAYFNTAVFAQNALGTFGNSGRNILRGLRSFNIDFSAQKYFRVTEAVRIQFRSEFFNLTNTPKFSPPLSRVTDRAFGQILAAGDPRILQFGLKVLF